MQCWLDMFCHLTYCLMHAVNQAIGRIVNNISVLNRYVERVCLRPTRATTTSYCVRSLFVVTPFHAFHSSAFSLILSACLQESSTHGVGLFAVKDMKTGHFTDINCFGTFVLYYTKTEVHDAIAADGVPRYMVASMYVGGEVLCRTPH